MIWISWEKNQSLQEITSKILANFDPVVKKEQPDLVLVHADTKTTFAAGLVAFYNKVSIGHVEAGLRTYDKYSPYPEEMNRQVTVVTNSIHHAVKLVDLGISTRIIGGKVKHSTDASKLGQVTYAKVAEVEKVTIITNASEEELLKELKEKTRVIEV